MKKIILLLAVVTYSNLSTCQTSDTTRLIRDTIMRNASKFVNKKFEKLDSALQRIKIKEIYSNELFKYTLIDSLPNDSFKIQSVDVYFQDTKNFLLYLKQKTKPPILKIKFRNPIKIHFRDMKDFDFNYNAKVKAYLSKQIISSMKMKYE
jgi:hypothetical protein